MSLDDRKAKILRAVVEEYIDTAQPVGSGRVATASGVNVSSATVRNDMATLEQEGYLRQPHTSAGRVPTEKGYRFFVDGLGDPSPLAGRDAQQVRTFFAKAHGELEQMLQDTSKLLAGLTAYTAVVVGPPHEAATIRSVQLVGLTPRVALLVVVLSNGVIEKHTLELAADTDPLVLDAAGALLRPAPDRRDPALGARVGHRARRGTTRSSPRPRGLAARRDPGQRARLHRRAAGPGPGPPPPPGSLSLSGFFMAHGHMALALALALAMAVFSTYATGGSPELALLLAELVGDELVENMFRAT